MTFNGLQLRAHIHVTWWPVISKKVSESSWLLSKSTLSSCCSFTKPSNSPKFLIVFVQDTKSTSEKKNVHLHYKKYSIHVPVISNDNKLFCTGRHYLLLSQTPSRRYKYNSQVNSVSPHSSSHVCCSSILSLVQFLFSFVLFDVNIW